MATNPLNYEADGAFNLPLFLYDTLKDIMKQEFDQIRSVIKDEEEADRIVRLIKSRYRQAWIAISVSLFRVGLIEPCTCKPKENCPKCHGAQWLMVKGLDYEAMREHADLVLREILTRRSQDIVWDYSQNDKEDEA